jgi:hypothetical protein
MSGNSLVPVNASLRRATFFIAFGSRRRDGLLDQARFERRDRTARALDLLELRPPRHAKLLRQILDPARAGRGVRDLREIRFFQQNELRVARDAPRECVGQSERDREGEHCDGIRAAHARRRDRDRRAQHVHVRIAPRRHAPRRLGGDEHRHRLKPAGLLNARPQFPDRAEFRDRQKLVGIRSKTKIDRSARCIE